MRIGKIKKVDLNIYSTETPENLNSHSSEKCLCWKVYSIGIFESTFLDIIYSHNIHSTPEIITVLK